MPPRSYRWATHNTAAEVSAGGRGAGEGAGPRQIETLRAKLEKQFPRLSISQASDVADQAEMVQYIQGFAVVIALLAVVIGGVG